MVHHLSKKYQIKRSVDVDFKNNFNDQIAFDEQIPKWNYLIRPS